MQNLNNSTSISTHTKDSEISIYKPSDLTIKVELDCVRKLKLSFPQLPIGFYDILHDRLIANGFTDQRLNDAVSNLVDTCVYPTPTIANIISFDRRIKLHTYEDMTDQVDQYGPGVWDRFAKKRVNGRLYWINKREADQYGITIETTEP